MQAYRKDTQIRHGTALEGYAHFPAFAGNCMNLAMVHGEKVTTDSLAREAADEVQ